MNQRQPTSSWDRDALIGGALIGSAITVPAGLIGAASDNDAVTVIMTITVIFGLLLASVYTAWRQRIDKPISHAIVVAAEIFVITQLAGWVRRLIVNQAIDWNRSIANALLCVVFGTVGGVIGAKLRTVAGPSS
jgi:xanthosine utilization system XapX-like protein